MDIEQKVDSILSSWESTLNLTITKFKRDGSGIAKNIVWQLTMFAGKGHFFTVTLNSQNVNNVYLDLNEGKILEIDSNIEIPMSNEICLSFLREHSQAQSRHYMYDCILKEQTLYLKKGHLAVIKVKDDTVVSAFTDKECEVGDYLVIDVLKGSDNVEIRNGAQLSEFIISNKELPAELEEAGFSSYTSREACFVLKYDEDFLDMFFEGCFGGSVPYSFSGNSDFYKVNIGDYLVVRIDRVGNDISKTVTALSESQLARDYLPV